LAGFGSGDIADCLMYTFGIEGALPVAQILQNVGFSAFEIGYVLQTIFDHDLDGVSQVLHDLGFTMEHGSAALAALGAKAYPLYDILKTVWELHPIDARLRLVYLGYGEEDIFQVTIGDLAAQYAPQLRFDSGSRENSGRDSYPMSAQEYYNSVIDTYLYLTPHFPVLNPNGNSVNQQQVPTYWRAYRCYSGMPWSSEQIRIIYWWYYGYQDSCDGVSGAHHGDWERIMVTLSEDATMIGAVTYVQHSGHYTRLNVRGGFELIDGTHPVVYVGRANHGSYHNTQTAVQTCCYWEDHRDGQGPWLSTWLAPRIRLQPVEDGGEPWMDVLPGSFTWGYDGISTHPVTVSGEGDNPFTCLMNTCRGTDTWGCQTSGCFRSQCAVGDRDDGVFCRHCAAGWTDMGAHCAKGGSTHEMNVYSFEYLLPLDDWLLFYKSPFWYE
ncbi:MAG: NPP1 family protein, partial [Candidatus Thiodiazotropha sp. (ex Rostrolucina anterorostrata)]|nr:NPP1 family protein [Candidatus Thiodiazotropha sp. (ex Rostrolucina anterorostrata)]